MGSMGPNKPTPGFVKLTKTGKRDLWTGQGTFLFKS